MDVDVVAIGAHPDDIDLSVGGTIAKLVDRGKRVVAVDLTCGEGGTRGTPEMRRKEAKDAAEILGLTDRLCLDMGDARLENTLENRVRIIEIIREYRPTIVMANFWEDLHPDQSGAGKLVRDIMYTIGMLNFPAKGDPCRPNEFLFYMAHFPFEPSFIVDISDHFERKIKAIQCFKSQLADPTIKGLETNISQPDFLLKIEARARYYGSLISKKYGEPFFVRRIVPIDDPVELYKPFPKF